MHVEVLFGWNNTEALLLLLKCRERLTDCLEIPSGQEKGNTVNFPESASSKQYLKYSEKLWDAFLQNEVQS